MVRQSGSGQVRVGVSACLLGHEVRYDGGHKRDAFLTETLGRFVEFVPVCPEVELGLGVPRESVRLERGRDEIRMIGNDSGSDYTVSMREYAEQRVDTIASLELCGYILKHNSPSCGLESVTIFGEPNLSGRGLFAANLTRRLPLLPVAEETSLKDIPSREHFVERIFAYHRLRSFFDNGWARTSLFSFHEIHELQLMAHSAQSYDELLRLIDTAASAVLRERYEAGFMLAISEHPEPAQHVRVLRRISNHVRPHLGQAECNELDEAISTYQAGRTTWFATISSMLHYIEQFEIDYFKRQTYLEPYPLELMVQPLG